MADAKFVAIETSALMELREVISTDQATVRVPLKITISPESVRILPPRKVFKHKDYPTTLDRIRRLAPRGTPGV